MSLPLTRRSPSHSLFPFPRHIPSPLLPLLQRVQVLLRLSAARSYLTYPHHRRHCPSVATLSLTLTCCMLFNRRCAPYTVSRSFPLLRSPLRATLYIVPPHRFVLLLLNRLCFGPYCFFFSIFRLVPTPSSSSSSFDHANRYEHCPCSLFYEVHYGPPCMYLLYVCFFFFSIFALVYDSSSSS